METDEANNEGMNTSGRCKRTASEDLTKEVFESSMEAEDDEQEMDEEYDDEGVEDDYYDGCYSYDQGDTDAAQEMSAETRKNDSKPTEVTTRPKTISAKRHQPRPIPGSSADLIEKFGL